MSTLWQPDVCGCEFIADSNTFAFESQTKSCPEHEAIGLTGKESFIQAISECSVKSHTVVEAQQAFPEIRSATADPSVQSEESLDPKKVTLAFDVDRKFIFTVQLDPLKKLAIQAAVDLKVGAGKAIIQ